MKILLCSIGTRGDVEPFLALGDLLRGQGHQVYFAFPEQFASLVPETCPFHALSASFLDLIESSDGKIVMGGKASPLAKLRALYNLYQRGKSVNQLLVRQQYEIIRELQPDMIIHNAKCSYPSLWGMQQQKEVVLMSPVPYFMYYVEGHAHVGFKGNLGRWLNQLSYRLANFGMVKTIRDAQKSLPVNHRFSSAEIRASIFSNTLLYAISPSLFQRPEEWPAHVQVVGYLEKKKEHTGQIEESLLNFVEQHQKILLLTFGSMVNQAPEALSRLIYSVLRELEIPTVVNTAAGGLMALDDYLQNPLFCFVKSVPYDWLLLRMYAVMHHGGSGTTHLGLKYACPTLIIPHILDQYSWNALVHQVGAGPKGIGVSKLNKQKLRKLLKDLMLNASYKQKAIQLSKKMERESDHGHMLNLISG